MAIAIEFLKHNGKIQSSHILDFDLHFGDGTVNILGQKGYVTIHNPEASTREAYLESVRTNLWKVTPDVIGVSAGFDNHVQDWGGLLTTDDYYEIGRMVFTRAKEIGAGTFGVLEGGYNHAVLGKNVRAFVRGLCGQPPLKEQ
jgi:acetoin utilization deacetylase AcuC-like enzyme